MKNRLKFLITLILTLSILCAAMIPSYAAETTVTPRFSNTHEASVSFVIDSSTGIGYFSVDYTGNENSFTYAKIEVNIQKSFLFLFWNDVGSWSATNTDILGIFHHEFELDGAGTYRATYTIEFYGTSGTVDVIQDYIERTY